MKPLSTLNYFKKNIKKILILSTSIGFAILFIYILSVTIKTVDLSQELIDSNPTEHFSIIIDRTEEGIPDEIIDEILQHPSTERTIGIWSVNTYYTHLMGGTMGVGIWFLNEVDSLYLLDKLQLQIKEGRLPQPGAKELALHELLLQNKGLKLGDKIGNSIISTEWIPGSYEIVGVLEGESITGFGVLEPEADDELLMKNMMMIFHKDGKLDDSNRFLNELIPKEMSLITNKNVKELMEENNRALYSVLNITLIVAIFVLSVTIGNSTYLQFFERKKEYALLRALGFSRGWIFGKAFREIAITSLVGLLFGVVLTGIVLILFIFLVFAKTGAPFQLFDLRAFIDSLTIVASALIFCLIPVWIFLSKINVIETIERGE